MHCLQKILLPESVSAFHLSDGLQNGSVLPIKGLGNFERGGDGLAVLDGEVLLEDVDLLLVHGILLCGLILPPH